MKALMPEIGIVLSAEVITTENEIWLKMEYK
jgi:hypothetical protein